MINIGQFCDQLTKEAISSGIKNLVVGGIISVEPKILLLKRKEDDFCPNVFEFPSGKVEKGESFVEALKREILEETALVMHKITKYIDYFDYVSASGNKSRQFNFLVEVLSIKEVLLSEHSTYKWISHEELTQYAITDPIKNTAIKFFQNQMVVF